MDILLSALGTAGDVHPTIGLALALKNRGHKVKIITNPYFKELTESWELDFISLGTIEQYLKTIENPDIWNPKKGFQAITKGLVLPAMRPLYEIITRYDPGKTMLVASSLSFGARLAQETHKFPLATTHLQPSVIRTIYETPTLPGVTLPKYLPRFVNRLLFSAIDYFLVDRVITPELNSLRKELGLDLIKNVFGKWLHSPEKVIGLFPEWFAPLQPDWPANTELTGFINFDASKSENPLSREIADFIGEEKQALIFTPGTAMKHGKVFFEASAQIAEKLGRPALLLTKFTSHLPAKLPPSVKPVAYIPFSLVLSKIGALVHHGGVGTCAQAIAAGIPQLIMPINHDQPDNATRLEKLGVAGTLYPKDYNVNMASKKLAYLLNSTEVLAQCKALQRKNNFNKALTDTCEIVEKVASRLNQ